ncbi:hypothetical protein KEM55_001254 [Ascosphaera atra]|nr:hypothetical protein KEM55_001254 [Ascosphaera atra]
MTALVAPSAVTSLIASSSGSEEPIKAIATQVLHNLRHQHLWRDLQIHDAHTLSPTQHTPVILGLPPQAVYTHPDEQVHMVQNGIRAEDVPVEKEWVLPTPQGQKWSLRRLAAIFDALPERSTMHEKKNQDWGGKRLLLAMVNTGMGGDGTVVYYVVLEGAVKPRQN